MPLLEKFTAISPITMERAVRLTILNRYFLFLATSYILSFIIVYSGGMGGLVQIDPTGLIYFEKEYLELLMLVYGYYYFNNILKPSKFQPYLAAMPILLAYIGQDIYYLTYSKVFRINELSSVSELFHIMPITFKILLIAAISLPTALFVCNLEYKRYIFIAIGLLPIAAIIITAERYPHAYFGLFKTLGGFVFSWDDVSNAEINGKFTMLLYREAERKTMLAQTEKFRDREGYENNAKEFANWIAANNPEKHNVHLIVMESFLDPSLFRRAQFTRDPAHPSFKKLFGDKMGFSISPVFGGSTSQAEFEVLCGVPAFGLLSGVEFNSFTGVQAYCLPGTLGLAGYQTIASNAYNPSFFNTTIAYRGIGFEETYFPQEYNETATTYLSNTEQIWGDNFVFDGDLFAQNLQFLKNLLQQETKRPIFNYLLTIYGHTPHQIDPRRHPEILKMTSTFKDPLLERSANQFFYRSQAVAEYVNRLLEIDKNSLIILVSDHLPPGEFGRLSFDRLGYMNNTEDSLHYNRILIIDNGKIKKYATMHHYDVPKLIVNYLTNGTYCKTNSCGFAKNKFIDDRSSRYDDYLRLMAHAVE